MPILSREVTFHMSSVGDLEEVDVPTDVTEGSEEI